MTKTEFIRKYAKDHKVSLKNAKQQVEWFLETISDVLIMGESVKFVGHFSMGNKYYKEKIGRNPKTGEEYKVEGCKKPWCKFSENIKQEVAKLR